MLAWTSACVVFVVILFFFFKQKTAYEMRISDWSSDVCSSDLRSGHREEGPAARPTTDECHVRAAARTAGGISCAERRLAAFRVPVTPPAPDGIRAVPDSEEDRKSGVEGKSGSVRVDLGGRRILKKTN